MRLEKDRTRHLISTLLKNTPQSLLRFSAQSIRSLPPSRCTQEQGEYGLQFFRQPYQFQDRV